MADDIYSILEEDGWREMPNALKTYARCFYKRFETPTRCRCNDKPGMQVAINVAEWANPTTGGTDISYEMDLSGEIENEVWAGLTFYSMPSDPRQGLSMIPKLLATWEVAAACKCTNPVKLSP